MKKKVLVSACLLGKNCRYNGGNSQSNELKDFEVEWIPVCPEELGKLGTPRPAAELLTNAKQVLSGNGKIVNIDGEIVTRLFIKGAEESLKIGQHSHITTAILKSRSPSCGLGEVYDGSFTGTIRKGNGVFTQLCLENKINCISSDDISQIKKTLTKLK